MLKEKTIKSYFFKKQTDFTRSYLCRKWGQEAFGLADNFIVGFIGPETIISEKFKKKIITKNRLHFVISHHSLSRIEAAFFRYLFASSLAIVLRPPFYQQNNSVYYQKRVFASSECVINEGDTLIHFRVLLEPEYKSKNKIGLLSLGIQPESFAVTVMNQYQKKLEKLVKSIKTIKI